MIHNNSYTIYDTQLLHLNSNYRDVDLKPTKRKSRRTEFSLMGHNSSVHSVVGNLVVVVLATIPCPILVLSSLAR